MSEDYNANKYNQPTPTPAKFLHLDGTVFKAINIE